MPLLPSVRKAAAEGAAAGRDHPHHGGRALCLLLLPTTLEQFILRDQAQDLLQAPDVIAVEAPRVPYGAVGRLPDVLRDTIGGGQGKRIVKAIHKRGDRVACVVVFHPLQYPLARGILAHEPDCELWYGRWDRFEHAYDAKPRMRERLADLHTQCAARSSLTFTASTELERLEREAGREATTVTLAADAFPALDTTQTVVAVSLGHLGWRTDWALLRAVAERMPELVLLLVGAWHDDECAGDEDYRACREAPNLVWLGRQDDQAAARLIACADVGIVPFRAEPFNDAGLPYRILKYARLGRRTVSPPLAGVRTWDRAVTIAPDADAFVAALRAEKGTRARPDADLRAWALEQTAHAIDAPLWERLRALGVDTGGR